MGDEGFGTAGDDEIDERFARYLAAESNRGFGDIPLRSEAAVSPFSRARMEAASNLLDKAQRALREGNDERARRMVERAVALPYDEVERAHPAAWQAHMAMFMAVTDAAEEDDGEDWLDAVVDTFRAAGEEARFTLRDCVVDILQDYELSGYDRRRLRDAVAKVPARAQLHELDLTPDELSVAILDILAGVALYEESYAERSALSDAER